MAIQNEVWAQDIQKILFQTDLDFLNLATSHDSFAVGPDGKGYKKVHLPQAGAFGSGITTNYSGSYPRTVSQRTDTEFEYPIDEYTTDPIIYTYAEELQVSYPKRESIIRQQVELMAQKIGSNVLYKWSQDTIGATAAGAPAVVRTTGATSSLYNEGAQTGSRRLITLADIINLGLILDRQFVPKNDRYLMLPSTLYYQMFEIPQFNNAVNFYGFTKDKNTLPGGELPEVMGFKILHRPVVAAYYGSTATGGVIGNLIEPDATGLITSALDAAGNLAGIAFQKDMVAKAFGGVQAFQGIPTNPLYNGGQDLMALVMMGATKLRQDKRGVVMLVQQ